MYIKKLNICYICIMDVNSLLKQFLLTTGVEFVHAIKERDRLVQEEECAYQEAERASRSLCEHRKKFNEIEKKFEKTLIDLVQAISKPVSSEETMRRCSEFEQYKSFSRN
jgi:hypothetical protein